MKRIILTAALALVASGCASLEPARMALPANLSESVETATVDGITGGRNGSFSAGHFSGTFSRSATRLAFFEPLYERRDGRTSFVVSGPEINGAITVSCKMRERAITLGLLSFEPSPMAYGCDFSHEGRALPARFEVQAHRQGVGGMMMRQERRGQIALDRVVLQIRSVHDLQGSPIQIGAPIGYVFERDGQAVGAVDIIGAPVITYAAGENAETRRAVLMASLALGLFWDPAESALGREAE
jgi:hypothetical protein